MAALARMNGKPVYAVAESYKFLRYYPLGPDDLPRTQMWVPFAPALTGAPGAPARGKGKEREGRWIDEPRPLEFDEIDEEDDECGGDEVHPLGHSRRGTIAPAEPHRIDTHDGAAIHERSSASRLYGANVRWDMTLEMEAKQPLFDITTPELIDFVITDLGALWVLGRRRQGRPGDVGADRRARAMQITDVRLAVSGRAVLVVKYSRATRAVTCSDCASSKRGKAYELAICMSPALAR